jgi:ABC-type sugar transport system ATPase subunit
VSQALSLTGIDKRFGATPVLHDVNLAIAQGEFVVFVGPSGCGKSTLLRLIAGLDQPSAGVIAINGRDVTTTPAASRGIAMVFQSYALYPHMSVYANMAFGLETQGLPKPEIERRVRAAAELLKLDALLDRKPKALSGGQRQRVAIGRAIVREPVLFLFDEPLSNLDAELRVQMRVEIARLHKRLGVTSIYVTHDQVEAMTMADRIVVLNAGRVQQVGSPLELYNEPANRFVAGFLGAPRMNLIDGEHAAASFVAGGLEIAAAPPPGATAIGIRPEAITLGPGPQLPVLLAEQLGAETIIHLGLPAGGELVATVPGQHRFPVGEPVGVTLPTTAFHWFNAAGMAIRLR